MKEKELILTKILVEIMIFLEFVEDEDVNPDVALALMEQLSSYLSTLEQIDKKELADSIRNMANAYPKKEQAFVLNLPETLGLE